MPRRGDAVTLADSPTASSMPEGGHGVPVLAAHEVTVRFGGLRALSDVSIEVPPGSIVGLVGPNGAGKTTLFGVLSGLLRPSAGRVTLRGEDITEVSPQARARMGLARTFQQPELFMGLTVREHLVLGHRVRFARTRLWRDMFNPIALFLPTRQEDERVDSLIDLLELRPVADVPVAALPLGTSRLVEVGRALATRPDVLLLDEPLSGLDLRAAENLSAVFRRVVDNAEHQVSLLLVEHDVAAVLALSSSIFVLDFGELIASGNPDQIRNDPAVRSAYLGDDTVVSRTGASVNGTAAGTPAAQGLDGALGDPGNANGGSGVDGAGANGKVVG